MPVTGNDVVLFDGTGTEVGTLANPLKVDGPGAGVSANLASVAGVPINYGTPFQGGKIPVDLYDYQGLGIKGSPMVSGVMVNTEIGLQTASAVYGHWIFNNQPYPIDADRPSTAFNTAAMALYTRTDLGAVGGATVALGQAAMASSIPVVLANNPTQTFAASWPVVEFIGAGAVSATNGSYANLLQGNAVISAANPIFSALSIAGAVVSATNGEYANLLQGNAVISATNGLFSNLLQGNAVLSAANPIFSQTSQGGSAVGGANPLSVRLWGASTDPIVFQTINGATFANSFIGMPTNAALYAWDIANNTRTLSLHGRAQNGTWTATDNALNVNAHIQGVLGAVMSAANPIFSALSIAGAVVSATNGEYANLLQGNAVLSVTNTLPMTPTPIAANTWAPSMYSSAAAEASAVIKASTGNVQGIFISNGATAQWIQLFNSTTVPADGATPVLTFRIAATNHLVTLSPANTGGWPFSTGIAISNSSTQATKTIGAADCMFTVVYK